MDNLTFQKKWQDDDVIELFICGKSKYAEVCQSCYVGEEILSQYYLRDLFTDETGRLIEMPAT